jgi:hypothetical protein
MTRLMKEHGWELTFMLDQMNKRTFFRAENHDTMITAMTINDLFDKWTEEPAVIESVFGMKAVITNQMEG